ncbi:MAG TPA: hypothetical protein VK179_19455 [Bacteroidales bacterium]|nr:hypothetical protein [Bacteroidales bacterium]
MKTNEKINELAGYLAAYMLRGRNPAEFDMRNIKVIEFVASYDDLFNHEEFLDDRDIIIEYEPEIISAACGRTILYVERYPGGMDIGYKYKDEYDAEAPMLFSFDTDATDEEGIIEDFLTAFMPLVNVGKN